MSQDRPNLASDCRPLHTRLREWLVASIDSYPEGARLPTEFELAERFGISRLTVHKVMGELQREGYVVRMRSKGTFVARKDQRVHGRNGAGHKGTVIVAYADWFSYDIWAKVEQAEVQAVKHGFSLVNLKLTRLGGYASLRALVDEFEDTRGVIVVPPGGNVSEADRTLLDAIGVPVVVLCEVDGLETTHNMATVCQDMDAIACTDIDLAVKRKSLRLAHINAEPWNPSLERFAHALRRHATGHIELVQPRPAVQPWHDSTAKAYHLALEVLTDDRVDALVLDSFPTALAASRAAQEVGRNDLLILIHAPYFGFERFLPHRSVLVFSDLRRLVSKAFELIGATAFPPPERQHRIEVTTHTPSPSDTPDPSL